MVRNRLQIKVTGSELSFSVCITAAVAMWWWPQQAVSTLNLVGCLLCLLTAFVVMETNTRQHIIRIRTRMMSCVWLILSASLSFMHPLGEPLVAASFLCISYMLLFRCYGKHRPQLTVFHAFVMLGMGSFCAPAMLLMGVPEETRQKKIKKVLSMDYLTIGRKVYEDFKQYVTETNEHALDEILKNTKIRTWK